jgi:hypothetical protein
VQETAFELNYHVILYLGFTPYQIYFGFQSFSKFEITNPNINQIEARVFLAEILILEELDNKIFDTMVFYSIIKKGRYNKNSLQNPIPQK